MAVQKVGPTMLFCNTNSHEASRVPHLVLIVALSQVMQDRWLIQVTEAGQVVHAVQDWRIRRHQQVRLCFDNLQADDGRHDLVYATAGVR